jgi:hypothetical protein
MYAVRVPGIRMASSEWSAYDSQLAPRHSPDSALGLRCSVIGFH